MRRLFLPAAVIAASLALGSSPAAQLNFPDIAYDAAEPLRFPPNIHLGEAAGVATNSKGDIFVYTRTGTPYITTAGARNVSHGGSRLFQFDRTGKFVGEIGQGAYGFLQAQQVRVDPQDNVWVVDQMSTQVIKFDPNGRITMVLSRKPEAMRVPNLPLNTPPDTYALVDRRPAPPAPAAEGRGAGPAGEGRGAGPGRGGALPGAGVNGESFNRPTDVAWDSAGNIYVADGYGNSRIAKYDKDGKWIKN
jgi:NHL repeat